MPAFNQTTIEYEVDAEMAFALFLVRLLALDGAQDALAQADGLGSDLHQLVILDVLQRLFEREGDRRGQLDGLVRSGGTLVAQVLRLGHVDHHIAFLGGLATIIPS